MLGRFYWNSVFVSVCATTSKAVTHSYLYPQILYIAHVQNLIDSLCWTAIQVVAFIGDFIFNLKSEITVIFFMTFSYFLNLVICNKVFRNRHIYKINYDTSKYCSMLLKCSLGKLCFLTLRILYFCAYCPVLTPYYGITIKLICMFLEYDNFKRSFSLMSCSAWKSVNKKL